jgi:hypothetical protein
MEQLINFQVLSYSKMKTRIGSNITILLWIPETNAPLHIFMFSMLYSPRRPGITPILSFDLLFHFADFGSAVCDVLVMGMDRVMARLEQLPQ